MVKGNEHFSNAGLGKNVIFIITEVLGIFCLHLNLSFIVSTALKLTAVTCQWLNE